MRRLVIFFFWASVSVKAHESAPSSMMTLVVGKESLTAELRLWSPKTLGPLIRRFPVAIGKNKGDKLHAGDLKTPEGIYFVQSWMDTSKINYEKYGSVALPLTFPNPMDRKDGKTGSGIWLHAGDAVRMMEAHTTEGCVIFYQADLLWLKDWLSEPTSLVVIAPQISYIQQNSHTLWERTHEWIEAWSHRNLEKYMDFYSQEFSQKCMNKNRYAHYKKRVFGSYKKMSLNMSDVHVMTHPKYAISIMNQTFQGDEVFFAKGKKTLYWTKVQGNWEIIAEHFSPGKFWEKKLIQTLPPEESAWGKTQ